MSDPRSTTPVSFATSRTPPPDPKPLLPERASSESPLVLVVDDEEAMRRVLRTVLERASYRVIEAASGQLAIDALRSCSDQPRAALIDMTMRGLDGLATTRALRSLQANLPVALMTGLPSSALTKQALDNGARHVMPKPFDVDAVLLIVAALISGSD